MKFYRSVHKTLNYHMKQILWQENKNIYFLLASEIYHCSILPKMERKSGKYFIRWQEYLSTTFSLQNDVWTMYVTFVEAAQRLL